MKVISGIELQQPKTKLVAELYKTLGLDRSVLVAINGREEMLERSARNIHRTTLTTVAQLNAWDILRSRTLLLTKAGLEMLLA